MTITNKLKISGVDITNTTITANGNSDSIKKTWADKLLLYIIVGTVSGSDSITFTIQTSNDNVNWHDKTGGAAITTGGNQTIAESDFGPYVRVKWVVAGSGISITGVNLSLVSKGGQ